AGGHRRHDHDITRHLGHGFQGRGGCDFARRDRDLLDDRRGGVDSVVAAEPRHDVPGDAAARSALDIGDRGEWGHRAEGAGRGRLVLCCVFTRDGCGGGGGRGPDGNPVGAVARRVEVGGADGGAYGRGGRG